MCFFPLCFTISTSEVGVIERFGKFDRLAKSGCHIICTPIDELVGTLTFRVQEVRTKQIDVVGWNLLSCLYCTQLMLIIFASLAQCPSRDQDT